jgi:geranylgeranyl pyrophosphate synthase
MVNNQKYYQERVEKVLEEALPSSEIAPYKLHEAMRYSVLGGGKRVRPLLVYATGKALDVNEAVLDKPAIAIELIHAYSLVHDDLPCMDDDDLRRGKQTTHIAFDEATAVLAGDALQTLAFDVLSASSLQNISLQNQLKLLNILANASGIAGMVKGQAIDLAAVGKKLTEEELALMHENKTGALIRASVLMASYCNEDHGSDKLQEKRSCLVKYADAIGLAFQVRDDILDIQSDTETLGKKQGADLAADKPTYPSILGMDAAKEKLFHLHKKAVNSILEFGHEADMLREIAGYIVKRIA